MSQQKSKKAAVDRAANFFQYLLKNYGAFVGALITVDLIFILLLWNERSFGGDFWLHLWLIDLQKTSFDTFSLPALLASFSPAGALSTAPLFTGGVTYSIAGLLNAAGASTYASAITISIAAFNIAFISCYVALSNFIIPKIARIALSFVPLAFAFPIGDGFGRGGLSSMIAGLFGISAVVLLYNLLINPKTSRLLILITGLMVFAATSTHLPSAIIFGTLSVPMIVLAGIFSKARLQRVGLIKACYSLIAGFAMSAVYIVPTLLWAIQASKQATQNEPFQLGASQYFADPFYQWNIFRLVPPGHQEFWTSQTSDGSYTSLITTLPTILYLLVLWGLILYILQRKVRDYLVFFVPLLITTGLLIFPEVWTFFPYAIRSLQYSFRVSYSIVPWLFFCLAIFVELSQQFGPKKLASALLIVSISVCSIQSFVQLANTVNLSILPTGDPLRRFVRDIKPSEMLNVSSPDYFWYSAGEQQAVDNIKNTINADGCSYLDTVKKWPDFPGKWGISINSRYPCVYFSMNIPVSWLNFGNATVVGRDPSTLNLIIRQNNSNLPMTISIKNMSPFTISAGMSVVGSVMLALSPLLVRRRQQIT